MAIPATLRAGDSWSWRDTPTTDSLGNPIDNSWSQSYIFRTNTAAAGLTVVSNSYQTGWQTDVSATATATLAAGLWFWQRLVTSGANVLTLGTGELRILEALAYPGTPGAYDGRSQAEKDLEAVSAAIRALVSKGAKSYTIGTRRFDAADLAELIKRESQLKAIVNRERAAEKVAAGLGDPRSVFVRF